MSFPSFVEVTAQVTALIIQLEDEMDRQGLQDKLSLSYNENFRLKYLKPALESGLIEMTLPDKPNSSLQKYRLTQLGLDFKQKL